MCCCKLHLCLLCFPKAREDPSCLAVHRIYTPSSHYCPRGSSQVLQHPYRFDNLLHLISSCVYSMPWVLNGHPGQAQASEGDLVADLAFGCCPELNHPPGTAFPSSSWEGMTAQPAFPVLLPWLCFLKNSTSKNFPSVPDPQVN